MSHGVALETAAFLQVFTWPCPAEQPGRLFKEERSEGGGPEVDAFDLNSAPACFSD